MQCEAPLHTLLTREGVLLGLRLVTASRQGIVKGELLCFASLQLQADRNSSLFPLNKEINIKFIKIYFANFKIPFTRKN